ncbi:MAG TPA: 3'-5' exonuclease [Dictyoglomaceae bacterium]|nr:3'-5' exonuclease [Dictyoglomaceae bacterium]HOL39628.1 3'-5' exonuclease [Dictyoglomaceae bacterium]HOP95150.1 3'-5' exonuclease [Dictyoglomaceae bacterium]HPP15200.1 3'-5' exonuclease [Dictyoglomaceae bacterium]HPU42606.1 3'-5' exonuclease [Dictyoglomaceae bacterium]
MDLLRELSKEQLEAVKTVDVPLLILAGAGSGKTRVITYKIVYLISEKISKPEEILALTFTNKAAGEMKRRIASLLSGEDAEKIWAGTFHGFGLYLLRVYGKNFGFLENFVIYDEDAQEEVIREILKEGGREEDYNPKDIKEKIARLKDKMLTPDEFSKNVSNSFDEIVLDVYKRYETSLRKNKAFDFADILIYAIRLLEENPALKGYLQEKLSYVLVDEYQDTNKIQYELFKILVQEKQKFSVVGDDDQSIYSWRGADYQNIFRLEEDFKNLRVVFLTKNYRSTQPILDIANTLIVNNDKRYKKELWSEKKNGSTPVLFRAINEEDEANFIVRQIKLEIIRGRKPSEIAVLYRTNRQSRVFEEALIRSNIPYKVIGGVSFFDRKEVKDIVAYLNILHNPDDIISLKRIINVPKRGIGETTFGSIKKLYDKGLTLMQAVEEISKTKKEVKEFYDMWKYFLEMEEQLTIEDLILLILEKTNYLKDYEKQGKEILEVKKENIMELIEFAQKYSDKKLDLGEFLSHLTLNSSAIESPLEEGDVSLITLHSVKGLEFEVVFLVGLEEGILPHYNATTKEEIQEERRLCYVGITRAKERLFMSYSSKRFNRYQEPSRFIQEMSHLLSIKK